MLRTGVKISNYPCFPITGGKSKNVKTGLGVIMYRAMPDIVYGPAKTDNYNTI